MSLRMEGWNSFMNGSGLALLLADSTRRFCMGETPHRAAMPANSLVALRRSPCV